MVVNIQITFSHSEFCFDRSSLLTSQKGLTKYLSYLGIDATILTVDNLTDRINLYAPKTIYQK